MAEQSAQQEPSMEEILASIRRIISEDGEEEAGGEMPAEATGPVAVEDVAAEVEPETEPEPEAMQAAPEPEPEQEDIVDEMASEPDPEPEPKDVPEAELAQAAAMDDFDSIDVTDTPVDDGIDDNDDVLDLTEVAAEPANSADPIVSTMTAAATSEHLKALSGMMVQNYPGAENTLDGLVRQMLKPMLREWLDANLPTLVEQMVNREIARIAGRDK